MKKYIKKLSMDEKNHINLRKLVSIYQNFVVCAYIFGIENFYKKGNVKFYERKIYEWPSYSCR